MGSEMCIRDSYGRFAEEYMAMPVVKGEKTRDERFPGAVNTYSIEAMMQDHKALQAGTSHFLGQNFSKACKINFLNQEGQEVFAWTTSWGVSTRLIGGLIMTHSDDDGLVLPPRLAPRHVVIIPIFRGDDDRSEVLGYCEKLKAEIETREYDDGKVRVELDDRDIRGGEKVWQHIKKGVPIRLEVGPRDIASDSVFMGRRDFSPKDKSGVSREEFVTRVPEILGEIQKGLYDKALKFREDRTRTIDNLDEFREFFSSEAEGGFAGGFALSHFADDGGGEALLKELKVTPRCIPVDEAGNLGECIFTGKPGSRLTVFAKAY